MPRQGAVTLSDLTGTTLTLVCEPCGRKGVYSVARLRAKHGDAKSPGLRVAELPQRRVEAVRQSDQNEALPLQRMA
jgi:hypothetical protein